MKTGAEERSRIYGLLAHVYYHEPDARFLKSFMEPAFLATLEGIGIDLGEYFRERSTEALVEELAVEYTRLFLGPGKHIYPYESAYRSEEDPRGRDAGGEVRNLIQASGLDYAPDYRDAPDHISIQLEFMEKLTEAEGRAWEHEDTDTATGYLEIERRFLRDHLAQWVSEFSERVAANARTSLYREMAVLTREFVLADADAVEESIEEVRTPGGS
jgi:TorA maturation chaperone TorD